MSLCVHCATPLPDGSRFCSHCGTPVPGQPQDEADSPTITPQGREIFDRLKEATADRYEILRELGRGGMAVVFLGYQRSLDREIAIKVLLPFLSYDTELVERFLREARTQGKLDHPFIIKVHEVHHEGGLTFFTMPFVGGSSLRSLLQHTTQPLPLLQVHRYLCQAADALAYAHRRGVIHRDVKPDNMILDDDRDCVILTDFGIAKALAAETTLTTPGDLLGTPQYMSPEQGEGKHDLDGRADQYSLGLIGYEMLTGRRAFRADNLAELMYKHRFEEPEPLDRIRPDVPFSLRLTIGRAISKDREDRFPSMEALLSALESCASDLVAADTARTEPMPPRNGETTVRVPTPPQRTPTGRTPPPESPAQTPRPPTPRTPTPRTPAPTPSWLTPPAPQASPGGPATPDPAADSADSWSSAVAPTVTPERSRSPYYPAAAAGRRRRNTPMIWAALSVVLIAALGGLYVWGPLGSWFQRDGTAGTRVGAPETESAEGPSLEPVTTSPTAEATPEVGEEAGGGAGGAGGAGGSGQGEVVTRPASTEEPARTATRDVPPASPPVDERAEAAARAAEARAAAVRGRSAAETSHRQAVQLGAGDFFAQELTDLEGRLRTAERQYANGNFADATRGFTQVTRRFDDLARRTRTELGRGGMEALAARGRMEQQQQAAQEAGAREVAPQSLIGAGMVASQARQEFERRNYGEAARLYDEAAGLYERVVALAIAEATRPGQQEVEMPVDSGRVEEPLREEPTPPAVPPQQLILGLVTRFTELFAAEDATRMASELYGGTMPRADSDLLKVIFERADDIQVTPPEPEIRVDGNSARAEFRLHWRFRQGTSGEAREMDLRLRLHFASGPDRWRLQRLERR